MHRIVRSRVLTKCVSSHQSKFFTTNVRLYCNHIKPESSSAGGDGGSVTDDQKRYEIRGSSQRRILDDRKSSSEKDTGWVQKVVYSSFFEQFLPQTGYREKLSERFLSKEESREELLGKTVSMLPVSVKYLLDDVDEAEGAESKEGKGSQEESSEEGVQFPFRVVSKTQFTDEGTRGPEEQHPREGDEQSMDKTAPKLVSVAEKLRKLEVDIDSVLEGPPKESDLFESAVEICIANEGTPDPKTPPSNVPCGGCGAFLHCQDQSVPGYIASEKFKGSKRKDLMAEVCYRCSVLESHQATLDVNVSAEEYPRIVGKIRERFAMVLLMVDLTDFPCSIWPGILNIIGNRRPVFLVGNKVDMIPQDSPDYLKRIEDNLIKCAVEVGMFEANILHTALISAKTGYGVENLVSTIFNLWRGRGDIFIMGCTNVGKSSLFNIFLQSDLCKPQAYEKVQQATISQWPGTTLNLLKFPMTNPVGWRKMLRYKRLCSESPQLKAEEKERHMQFETTKNPEFVTLTGYVGKTFTAQPKLDAAEDAITVKDPFQVNPYTNAPPHIQKPGQWDPDDPAFARGYWVYDTPGAVNTNQILDLLTLPELMESLHKTLIQPRTFFIKPQMTFFVGGLVRIDHVEGEHPIRYTLFSNAALPVTMTLTEDADEVYEKAIGTRVFGVPSGNTQRMEQFPKLLGRRMDFKGSGNNYSCADIVVSSIGWIAVTPGQQKPFSLLVHTPEGKGIFIRQPALLPYAVNWKGKRIRGTYSYMPHKVYEPNKQYKVKRPPRPTINLLRNYERRNSYS